MWEDLDHCFQNLTFETYVHLFPFSQCLPSPPSHPPAASPQAPSPSVAASLPCRSRILGLVTSQLSPVYLPPQCRCHRRLNDVAASAVVSKSVSAGDFSFAWNTFPSHLADLFVNTLVAYYLIVLEQHSLPLLIS